MTSQDSPIASPAKAPTTLKAPPAAHHDDDVAARQRQRRFPEGHHSSVTRTPSWKRGGPHKAHGPSFKDQGGEIGYRRCRDCSIPSEKTTPPALRSDSEDSDHDSVGTVEIMDNAPVHVAQTGTPSTQWGNSGRVELSVVTEPRLVTAINSDIKHATGADAILKVVSDDYHHFNKVNVSTAIHMLGRYHFKEAMTMAQTYPFKRVMMAGALPEFTSRYHSRCMPFSISFF